MSIPHIDFSKVLRTEWDREDKNKEQMQEAVVREF